MTLEVVGKEVIHKKYGEGVIISINANKWIIDFHGIERTIAYEMVLGTVLKFKDDTYTEKLLSKEEKQSPKVEEKQIFHERLWESYDVFGFIMELCKKKSTGQFENVHLEEIEEYFVANREMSSKEKEELRNALQVVFQTPYEEYPIYPVVLIETNSSEGKRYYARNIMDDKGNCVNLTYQNPKLQEAIAILAYWCLMDDETTIRCATEVTSYTEDAMHYCDFEKQVNQEIQEIYLREKATPYFKNCKSTVTIGNQYYYGFYYPIKQRWNSIWWGGHSEFGNGSDVRITYILPIIIGYHNKYSPFKAIKKLWEWKEQIKEYKQSYISRGVYHDKLGYGKIVHVFDGYGRMQERNKISAFDILFYNDKEKIYYPYEQFENSPQIRLLDELENQHYLDEIYRQYQSQLNNKKVYIKGELDRYKYYGDIEKFEKGIIYIKQDEKVNKRTFRYPETEISGDIMIVR